MILSEHLYRAAFESAADALLLCGDGRVAAANASARRLFGAPLDGRDLASLVPSPTGDLEQRLKAARGGAPQRFPLTCQAEGGAAFGAEVTITSLGEEGLGAEILVAVREVGSRVESTPELHVGEDELRAILDGLPISVSIVAADGTLLWSSRRDGVLEGRVAGRTVLSMVQPEHRADVQRLLEDVVTTGRATRLEMPVVNPGAEPIWQEIHAGPFRRRGKIEGLAVVTFDIDARRRADRARAESEEKLRSLLESVPGQIMILDKEHRITTINRIAPGFTAEMILGEKALTFVPPAFRETAQRAFEHVFRTGEPTSYETVTVLGSDQEPIWYAVHVGAIRKGDAVEALMLATEDITERKRLEDELRLSLERAQGYATELEEKNQALQDENAERRRTEDDLIREREVVSRLSTPIIRAWDGVLVLPIIGGVDSERAAQMMERLLEEIAGSRARFAVLDLTGVDMVDAETMGYIVNIVRAAGLLGSRCLVSGISPKVAQAMIILGAETQGFRTFGQMQDALRFALAASGALRGGD